MRILKISAKNINSLKGETEIDFEGSFGASALFAITGPTGAGKSTILDIISCALYARTARLQNPSELMSRNSGEAMCEVEFEIKAKRYRATWSQKRARGRHDGNLQPAKMELFDFDAEKIIESGVSKVPKKIEEICGLDFHRFTQSMMLAQGSFDAFLKANEKDRSELLEKITGTKIYAEISKRVYERHKALEQRFEAEKEKLGMISLLDDATLAEKKSAFTQLTAQKNLLKESTTTLLKQIQWHTQKERLDEDLQSAQKAFETAKVQKEESYEAFARLASATKARKIALLYREKEELAKRLQEQKRKYESEFAQLKTFKHEETIQADVFERLQAHFVEEKRVYTQKKELLKEVRTLLTEEKNLLKQLHEKEIASEEVSKEEAHLSHLLQEKEKFIATKERLCDEHRNYLSTHNEDAVLHETFGVIEEMASQIFSLQKTLAEKTEERKVLSEAVEVEKAQVLSLQEVYDVQKKRLDEISHAFEKEQEMFFSLQKEEPKIRAQLLQYKTLLQSYESYRERVHEVEKEKQQIELHTQQLESLYKERTQVVREISLTKEQSKLLRNQAEQALLIQKYEADRAKLKEGEPCFLCGATEHPYCHDASALSTESMQIEEAMKASEEALEKLEKRQLELEGEISELEGMRKGEKERLTEGQKQLQKLTQEFLNAGLDISTLGYADLHEKEKEYAEKLALYETTANKREALLREKEEYTEAVREKERQYASATKALDIKKSSLSHLETEIASLKAQEAKLTQTLRQKVSVYGVTFDPSGLSSVVTTLKERLERFKEQKSALEALQKQLQETKMTVTAKRTEFEALHAKKEQLQEEMDRLQKEVQEIRQKRIDRLNVEDVDLYEKEIDTKYEKLQEEVQTTREKLLALRERIEQSEAHLQALTQEMAQMETKREEVERTFHEALQKEGFASESAFLDAMLEEEVYEKLEKSCHEIERTFTNAQMLLKDRTEKVEKHQHSEDKNDTPLQTLQEQKMQKEQELENLQIEEGKLGEALRQDEENRKRYLKSAERIETLQKELALSGKLNNLIGSANGSTFAKFAQGITLDQLIALANRHLKLLHKRYILQRAKGEKQLLELEIVDTYQGNITRSVNTLSGGESFLVSLALALGLSELASQKIKIDSLFLDEGFGTLDEESLEMALNALSILQDSGKMIGVISHVNALKERIPLQINVQPKGDGTSVVEVKG